ncbi:hypothetical protein [Hymenobacter chitinivorans]|uniref:Uncharacterized protein n=1 Tax=Hymenobacter chitinivorans DSM 11115 TaxID=1121954 RepID=A0A2M9BAM6_9BACT|nr:hypothetical protein [Hymenobacter chitinivorans]PJJ54989.1 hypothetical protein CLV45_3337 [Hymenobacter chitinivorans DSM 11115]
MPKRLVLTACLAWTTAATLLAQTKPAAGSQPTPPAVVTSLKAHAAQYFADLNQRQREIYFAPSDGRAIALLSTAITEFGARKKGLVAEAEELKKLPVNMKMPVRLNLQSPTWAKDQQALLTSASAAKMKTRRQQNPALEAAFRRFDAAQLATLPAPLIPAD